MKNLSTDRVDNPAENSRAIDAELINLPPDDSMDGWRPANREDWIDIGLALMPVVLFWAVVIYIAVRSV